KHGGDSAADFFDDDFAAFVSERGVFLDRNDFSLFDPAGADVGAAEVNANEYVRLFHVSLSPPIFCHRLQELTKNFVANVFLQRTAGVSPATRDSQRNS